MPVTNWVDFTAGLREIPNRTDNTGTAIDDLPLREDALTNFLLNEGAIYPDNSFVPSAGSGDMDVDIGSGTAGQDIYSVESDSVGQPPYLVQLNDAIATVTLDAADADDRIDEIYLVVRDDALDGNTDGHRIARLSYRKGDSGTSPTAPGPDANWVNYTLLASIFVGAGVLSIGSADITDERIFSQLLQNVWDKAAQQSGSSYIVPSGGIIMWSGAIADIPEGWALCDGNNGTPNLLDRFVVGAGSQYNPDNTGGEDTHILTTSEIPSHAHGIGGSADSVLIDDQAAWAEGGPSSSNRPSLYGDTIRSTGDTNTAGGGNAHENRPPYYALAYIMKL